MHGATIGDTARVTTTASPPEPSRPVAVARAVPLVAAMSFVLVTAGVASYVVRGAPLQQLFDAWVFQNAPVAVVGATVFVLALRRQPRNRAAWAFFAAGVLSSLHVASTALLYAVAEQDPALWARLVADALVIGELPLAIGVTLWVTSSLWLPAAALLVLGLLYFPDGRLPSPRWRPVGWLTVAGLAVAETAWVWAYRPWSPHRVAFNFVPTDDRTVWLLFMVGMPVLGVGTLLTAGSLMARLRAADPDERRRVRPVAIAALLCLVAMVSLYPWQAVWAAASVPAVVLLLAAISGSVTRHRLFDVELVVSRAVTVALLGAVVTLLYISIVAGVGGLLGRSSRLWLSVAATAVVAVTFEPLRRRTLRLATRLVTGTATTPEETLAALSDQFARADSAIEVLDHVVELLVASTGASRAEVRIRRADGDSRLDAATGTASTDAARRIVPIVHAGETLGEVRLLAAREDRFLPSDRRLLQQVAAALGPVARNTRLTRQLREHIEELRASRQRILTAHDDARRTLERDIHDGAQQQLLSLRIKLGLAATLAEEDGTEALAHVVSDAADQADQAIRQLRSLARGLYPPVLAEQGLEVALRAQARDVPLPVTVDGGSVRRYDRATEAAVYFCCLEAMHNACRHADAATLHLVLSDHDGALVFAVVDDGAGFDPAAVAGGTGLANMSDRIEGAGGTLEITAGPGGGTIVRGRVPVASHPTGRRQEPVSER